MSSSAPRFVLHTVADHLNYTAAIGKEDAARLQDIRYRRGKHIEELQQKATKNKVNYCKENGRAVPKEFEPINKNKTNDEARKETQREIECNNEQSQDISHVPIDSNNNINRNKKSHEKLCTIKLNTTKESRRTHLNKLALPKVNCQCQKLLPRLPVQYRRDGVFDATYTPGVDYDRIMMPRVRVMSALSATCSYEKTPSSSSLCPAPNRCDNKKLQNNSNVVHNCKKKCTFHTQQNENELGRDEANEKVVLLASTVKEPKMCDESEENQYEKVWKNAELCKERENNDFQKVNTKHTRTPSVFSHSSSFGPITKLGVPHLTSHATSQSVQAHLAHLHAQRSRTESTLTVAKLHKHNEMYKSDANHVSSPHSQRPTPFHEMSTYELSRWLQQVQLHPTY